MLHTVVSDIGLYYFSMPNKKTLNQLPLSALCSRSLITPLDRGNCTQDWDDGSNTAILFMHSVIILYKDSLQ